MCTILDFTTNLVFFKNLKINVDNNSNHTGQGQFSDADQYLSQAQWSVLKTPDCEAWLKSQLHRNLGQLAAAKNSYPEARRHFAEDVG